MNRTDDTNIHEAGEGENWKKLNWANIRPVFKPQTTASRILCNRKDNIKLEKFQA